MGAPFGPGFAVVGQETLPGPWPSDSHWNLYLAPPGDEITRWWQVTINNITGQLDRIFPFDENNDMTWNSPHPLITAGQDVDLHLEWVQNPPFAIISTLTVPVKFNVEGYPYVTAQTTTTTGGLTTEQAAQLQMTTAAMGFAIGGGWSDLANDLVALVGRRIIGLELITPDRSGEGALTRPGGPFGVNAFGIQWQLISAPPGFGIDEGVPDRTEINHQDRKSVV